MIEKQGKMCFSSGTCRL